MRKKRYRVCPVEIAGSLDNRIRRWIQNPRKILMPYLRNGMKVMDIGCGPGFFSIEMAEMVGESGSVVAVDLQEGMLEILRDKIQGKKIGERIKLHKCEKDSIGVSECFDFVLAFYMVHEVPDKERFFNEIKSLLEPEGQFLIIEPKIVHVSKKAFEETIEKAEVIGLRPIGTPNVFFSRAVLLKNN